MIYVPFTSGKEGQGNHTTHHHAIFNCSDNLSTLQRFIVVLQKNILLIGWNFWIGYMSILLEETLRKLIFVYCTLSMHVLQHFFFKEMCSVETTALKVVVSLVVLNLLHPLMLHTCIKCRSLLAGCYRLIWQFERSVVGELKTHKDSCGLFFQATQPLIFDSMPYNRRTCTSTTIVSQF